MMTDLGDPSAPRSRAQNARSSFGRSGDFQPTLIKFTGVDEDTGTLNFELDANRFIAKNGKEYGSFDNSDATYFEEGWVDDDADVMGKFFGGGKKKAASGGKAGEDKSAGFKWPWE